MTALLAACFFVSGAAGLVYEVLWSRRLGLLFGVDAEAVAVVLAVFMTGLGAGSRALGGLADRVRAPLRLYAALEAGIGAFALGTGPLLSLVAVLYPRLAAILGGGTGAATAAKAVLSALVLFPPAFLMGGTLPAFARALARERTAPRTVSFLYAVNVAGAVFGAGVTGFWAVEHAGLAATMRAAAAADVLVACVALAAARSASVPLPVPRAEAPARESAGGLERAALAAGLFTSGAVFMLLEVVFTRLLAIAFGVSSYSFSLVLVACLLGLGLGGFAASRRAARPVGLDAFGRVQLASAAVAAGAMAAVPLVPRALALARQFPDVGFGATLALKAALAAALLVPLAAVAGVGLPLLLAYVASRPGRLGTSVGRASLVNTAGALAGSLLAGFVLVGAVGSQATLRLGALASVAAGLAALAAARGRPGAGATTGAAAVALVALLVPRWPDWVFLRADTTPRQAPAATRLEWEQRLRLSNLDRLFFEEGRSATVAVLQGVRTRTLVANGHPEASDASDMGTQLGVAIVPLALHPSPREVLVVGFASGVTAEAAARPPAVERVDVAELESAMFRAARLFGRANHSGLVNPKLRLHAADARALVASGGRRWDVVLSEPSNLWRAGVSNLFTSDFYASARGALKKGGVFAQWLQLYGLSWETLRTVFATFAGAFPHAEVWWLDGGDVVLLGTEAPLPIDRARVEAFLAGVYGADLRTHLATPEPSAFWARFLLGPEDLRSLVSGVSRTNTDDRPSVEFEAPRDLFRPREDNAGRLLAEKVARGRWAPAMDGEPPSRAEIWAGLAGMYGVLGKGAEARAAALRAFEDDARPAWALRAARYALADGDVGSAREDLARAQAAGADPAKAADVEGRVLALEGREEEAIAAFARARTDGPAGLERLSLLAIWGSEADTIAQADVLLAAYARGELAPADAAQVATELSRGVRTRAAARHALASLDARLGRDAEVPRIPLLMARAPLLVLAGRPADALRACDEAEALSAFDLDLFTARAAALRALGRTDEAARVEKERARWAGGPAPR